MKLTRRLKILYLKPSLLNYPSALDAWVSHKYRFLYFEVPKAASSSIVEWYAYIHGLHQPEHQSMREYIVCNKKAKKMRNIEFRESWSRYLKFAIVRNPYDRLVSAYRSIFITTPKMYRIGKKQGTYLKLYIPLLDEVSKFNNKEANEEEGVTFREFVKYIDGFLCKSKLNRHVRPQSFFVKKKYMDIIIKLEELANQQELLLEKIGCDIQIGVANTSNDRTKLLADTECYADVGSGDLQEISAVPYSECLYDEKLKKIVARIYQSDFQEFDYKLKQ